LSSVTEVSGGYRGFSAIASAIASTSVSMFWSAQYEVVLRPSRVRAPSVGKLERNIRDGEQARR
jgi:hypothetical protein